MRLCSRLMHWVDLNFLTRGIFDRHHLLKDTGERKAGASIVDILKKKSLFLTKQLLLVGRAGEKRKGQPPKPYEC